MLEAGGSDPLCGSQLPDGPHQPRRHPPALQPTRRVNHFGISTPPRARRRLHAVLGGSAFVCLTHTLLPVIVMRLGTLSDGT
jgi:hypothetical protein